MLSVPVGTVMSRLSRAREKLRAHGRRAAVRAARRQMSMQVAPPRNAIPRPTPTSTRTPTASLPRSACAVVEAALARDPSSLRASPRSARSRAALRDALDPLLAEPIPERLIDAATPPASRPGGACAAGSYRLSPLPRTLHARRRHRLVRARRVLERGGIADDVPAPGALAHALYAADANRPVEVWANEEKRLVTWLTKRLGFPVHAPDLNGVGYALVGGRLVAGNEKPTALLMYENADKQRLTLQVRKQSRGGKVGRHRRDGVPLRRRERRRRLLLDRRRTLRLRDLGQSRPRAAPRRSRTSSTASSRRAEGTATQ